MQMHLGERIKLEREKRGWSLTELAKRARMDVKTLSVIEIRKSQRSLFAPQIAQALEISIYDLLGETKPSALMVRSPASQYNSLDFDRETIEFAQAFSKLTRAERDKWMAQVLLLGEKVEKNT